jgi:hypothetical protein
LFTIRNEMYMWGSAGARVISFLLTQVPPEWVFGAMLGQVLPVFICCNLYFWMKGFVWVFPLLRKNQ